MKIVANPTLPKELFQVTSSPQLLAQAVRVYLANQRLGTQNAKTRAEVNRTRKKLYKQKGTGGARHGDRKAPIFVGGGIAFAPKPRDYTLKISQSMKKKALYGALTLKAKEKKLLVVTDFDKLAGKTAELAEFLAGLEGDSRHLLIVTDIYRPEVLRAGQNIPGVVISPLAQLSAYQVLLADQVLFMEEALKPSTPSSKSQTVIKKIPAKKIVMRTQAKKPITRVRAKTKK